MNRKLQRERTLAYWMVVAYGLIMFAVVWFTGCEKSAAQEPASTVHLETRDGYPEATYSYMAKHYLELEAQVKSLSEKLARANILLQGQCKDFPGIIFDECGDQWQMTTAGPVFKLYAPKTIKNPGNRPEQIWILPTGGLSSAGSFVEFNTRDKVINVTGTLYVNGVKIQ